MGTTVYGTSGMALLLSGSVSDRPAYCAIGTGSTVFSNTGSTLATESDRNAFTTTDASTQKYVTYTTDFNSVEMSGTALTEFGTFSSGAADKGTLWNKEGFASVSFDGSNELQIQVQFEIF